MSVLTRTEPHEPFWHVGFDWTPESTTTEVDEALRGDTENLRGEQAPFDYFLVTLEV